MTDAPLNVIAVLRRAVAAAWRRRYLICLPIALLPPVGLAVGVMAPKTYETRTTILVQESAKINPFLGDLAISTQLKDRIAALIALMRSRHVLGNVAVDLGLVNAESTQVEADRIYDSLARSTHVQLVGSDLIEIRYRASTPRGMDRVLDAISKRFIERVVAPAQSSLMDSLNFLEDQLRARREDLERAEVAQALFKSEHADELPDLHAGNVARLVQIRQTLAERRTQLSGAEAAIESMRSRLVQTNPVIGKLEEGIVGAMGELALLRARYTDSHSSVQAVLRKLSRLQEERARTLASGGSLSGADLDSLWNMAATSMAPVGGHQPLLVSQLDQVQTAKSAAARLQQEVQSLETAASELEARVGAFGAIERRLQDLKRDVSTKRELFDSLDRRYQMARLTSDLGRFESPERVKVIDRPVMPTSPTTPPTILFILAGLIGGIVLGCALAVSAEVADTTIRRHEDLERITGVPMLSRIPPLSPMAAASAIDLEVSQRT